MDKSDIPLETAQEPFEGAHQPSGETTMSPAPNHPAPNHRKKHGITFAEGTQSSEISSSQGNSIYKDALSQPGPGLSHKQRLLWIQRRRETGLWVQCDDCDKWRYVHDTVDKHELPSKWYCRLNPDRTASDCTVPEASIRLRDEEDLIHSEYSAGSVVWAHLAGWPWWPAMVDDCPDTEQFYWLDGFSDIPTHYNVVFFDAFEVTRAWIAPKDLKPYGPHKKALKYVVKNRKYKKRLEVALKQADDADMLPLANRLAKYSFVTRYKGNIGSPKKIGKLELQKFKNKLKRQLDIDFSDESDSNSNVDDDMLNTPLARITEQRRQEIKKNNVILVGTPKKVKKLKKNKKEQVKEKSVIDKEISINDSNKSSENEETLKPVEPIDSVFKQPDSMSVQIGSTLANDTIAIDNDSSKTYLPESEIADSLYSSRPETEFQVRIATPSSDDFEF